MAHEFKQANGFGPGAVEWYDHKPDWPLGFNRALGGLGEAEAMAAEIDAINARHPEIIASCGVKQDPGCKRFSIHARIDRRGNKAMIDMLRTGTSAQASLSADTLPVAANRKAVKLLRFLLGEL